MPTPTASASATVIPQGDGVLTFGTLLPTRGNTAAATKAQIAGVELAAREINESGGVNGNPIVVFHEDSGDESTEKAEAAFADLVSRKVDVIIGPSSVALAERLLPRASAAGAVMISPSATSASLASLPDDGLLFRTVPSEVLVGKALAQAIGEQRIAIIYASDDDGRAIRDEFVAEAKGTGAKIVATEGFSATTNDADKIVSVLAAADPDAVVVVGSSMADEKETTIIRALSDANFGGERLWLARSDTASVSSALPSGTLADVNLLVAGAAADAEFQKRVKSADPSVTDYRFAAEAYDATMLAALAATVTGNDSGRSVASALGQISSSGVACTSYGECLEMLKTRNDIDYDGVSGPLTLDSACDVRSAPYQIYRFDSDNASVFVRLVTVR